MNMTYEEREQLKRFADIIGGDPADDIGNDAAAMLVCIAHWFREPAPVSFTDYLMQWAKEDSGFDCAHLVTLWEEVK